MSRHQARAARRERQAAKALGTTRVIRERGESAPDVLPSQLPCGVCVQAEVNERAAPLRTVERWLSQCSAYAHRGVAPLLVVFAHSQRAGDALVVLRLDDFRRIAGLDRRDEPGDGPQQSLSFESEGQ